MARSADSALRLLRRADGRIAALLGATWRTRSARPDPRTELRRHSWPRYFHESMLPAPFFRDRGYGVAVSRSRDGDLIGATLAALGYAEAARGSSSRGGSRQCGPARELLRSLEAGRRSPSLVDGPRGPARPSPRPASCALARHRRPADPRRSRSRARPAWGFGAGTQPASRCPSRGSSAPSANRSRWRMRRSATTREHGGRRR